MTRDLLVRFSAVFLVFAAIAGATGAASASDLPAALATLAGSLALVTLGLAAGVRERPRRPALVRARRRDGGRRDAGRR